MAKSGEKRPLIKMRSTEGTGYTYVTRKNKTNTRERLELRKYDPVLRKHVIFKEERSDIRSAQEPSALTASPRQQWSPAKERPDGTSAGRFRFPSHFRSHR